MGEGWLVVVMLVTGVLSIGVVLFLAYLPGHIARERQHPSAEAISLAGWLSLLLWPLWFVAIIWAHSVPAKPKRAVRRQAYVPPAAAAGFVVDDTEQ